MHAGAKINPSCILSFARDNDVDMISTAVLRYGIAVQWANGIGQTALHVAALHGNVQAAATLLHLGADVNIRNLRGSSPLHFAAAAKKNTAEVCKLLLERGADTGISDDVGRLPYELAESDDIRVLLDGPDPRLFKYSEQGDLEGLRSLLAQDPELEVAAFNSQGQAPIHLAAIKGHVDVVSFLLEHDTFIDMQDMQGNTAVHYAVREGHGKLLGLLLQCGADLIVQNFHTSEYAQGNWLLKGEALGPLHHTPLHVAVDQGDAAVVKQLLEARAPVGVLDFDKKTALHLALEMQDEEIAELLLKHGADVNQGCTDFASPLHLAASRGMQQLLELLLSRGANVQAADEHGWTPLMLAVRAGKVQAVRTLLEHGADPSAANTFGSTSLHLAAINGKIEICRLLVAKCPAALSATNAEGALPADVAKTPEIAAVLREKDNS